MSWCISSLIPISAFWWSERRVIQLFCHTYMEQICVSWLKLWLEIFGPNQILYSLKLWTVKLRMYFRSRFRRNSCWPWQPSWNTRWPPLPLIKMQTTLHFDRTKSLYMVMRYAYGWHFWTVHLTSGRPEIIAKITFWWPFCFWPFWGI